MHVQQECSMEGARVLPSETALRVVTKTGSGLVCLTAVCSCSSP
jgi:hypothetical protein